MVHWALLCNRVAVESLACRPLGWAWEVWDPGVLQGPPGNSALLGVWPARRLSLQAVWPRAGLLLVFTHFLPPCDYNPGVWFVTPVLTTSLLFRARLWSHLPDPVSVEVCYSFRSHRVITHTSQTDDSFQPWLISALWPSESRWAPGPLS